MRFTALLSLVVSAAMAAPADVSTVTTGFGILEVNNTASASESGLEARDGSPHLLEVTTWSGGNCRGSSLLGYIDHYTEHCFNVPGASFSGLKSSRIPTGCAIKLYKSANCGGFISQRTASQNNQCFENQHFASYALKCCREFACTP